MSADFYFRVVFPADEQMYSPGSRAQDPRRVCVCRYDSCGLLSIGSLEKMAIVM